MTSRVFSVPLLLVIALSAQTKVDITAEPHHHLTLENKYVRVFDVSVPPGQATLPHVHSHDYVYVAIGPSEITNQVEGKPVTQTKLQDGQTQAVDGGFTHVVRTVSSTPFRNITVELLQDAEARKSPPPRWGPNGEDERGLQVLDGGTKDIMFVKDGVRVSEIDLRPGGMIPKHHHVGPHMIVAVTDLTLSTDVQGRGVSTIQLKAGESKWFPGDFTHTLMNIGKQQAKFVGLEFH
jgi:quercetin dioxygenase-like cupin family protein